MKIKLLIWCLVLGILSGCHDQRLYKDTQVMMGTFVEVISPSRDAPSLVFAEIKRIDNLLSKYKEDSEISRLNKSGKLKVSWETFYIVGRSKEFWQLTGGSFDIAVGSLIDLWGFTDKNYRVPSEAEIKRALKLAGSDKIILHKRNNVIEFKFSGIKIDLGAIAKGFAVDCAVKKLKESGIKSCLINAGGQIYCLGDRFGRPWRIAIKDPKRIGAVEYFEATDKAISTSGDYEQYFYKEGKHYGHIFNPKTGYPVENGVMSVTVVASDGLTADALSTSIFVLGKEKGEELASKFPDVKIRIITEDGIQRNK